MPFSQSFPRPLLCILATLTLVACTPPRAQVGLTEPPVPVLPATVRELTPDEAETMLTSVPGLIILDLRTESEAKSDGRLAGAQIYDYLHGEDTIKKIDTLPRDSRILLYCAIGGRAKLTAARMSEMGFSHVSLIEGGYNAWVAAGKTTQK